MNAIELVGSREELALARAVLYRFASDLFRDPLPEREAEWQRQSAGVLASLEVCQESGSPAALATALEACVSGASPREYRRDRRSGDVYFWGYRGMQGGPRHFCTSQ